jgi:hypothetical protein
MFLCIMVGVAAYYWLAGLLSTTMVIRERAYTSPIWYAPGKRDSRYGIRDARLKKRDPR